MHDSGPVGASLASAHSTAPPSHVLEIDTLDSLPTTLRRKGASAIAFLKKHFQWSEDGTVMLNNERLEKLPLMDLVHGLVRDRKSWSPSPNFDRAFRHLLRVGIPEALVHNKQLLNLPPAFDEDRDYPPSRK